MTPEEAREAAEVMLAFAEGAEIEYRNEASDHEWLPLPTPSWAWENSEYRVKPKLWRNKLWVHKNGSSLPFCGTEDPHRWVSSGWRLIEVEEVPA